MIASLFIVMMAANIALATPNHMHVLQGLYGNFSRGYDISVNRNIPPGIFDESVGGTIIPLGTYPDFGDTIDYFYGQSASYKPPPGAVIPPAVVYIREYVEDRNIVSATVDVETPRPANSTGLGEPATLTNFTFTGFYEFTNNTPSATLKRYNLIIPRVSEWFRAAYPTYGTYDASSHFRNHTMNTICNRHETGCANHRQYADKQACMDFLSTLEFGYFELAYENTTACRFVHSSMTLVRPEIHCPHVGPTGGMFCSGVRSYKEFYGQTFTAPMILE